MPGRAGRSIGILPAQADPVAGFVPLDGYPHPFVDIPILTPLPRREPDAAPLGKRMPRGEIASEIKQSASEIKQSV